MKHNAELISDDNGIEVLVGYNYDHAEGYYAEKDNPETWVDGRTYTELTSVEVVIYHQGVDILPILTEDQKLFIISKLTYND